MIEKNVARVGCALVIALVFFLVSIPVNSVAEDSSSLVAAGCKTEHFMLKDLASAYKNKTGNSIRLGRTGNKKAVTLLLQDEIDFAFTCKPIAKLSKTFNLDGASISDWTSVPIGKDPIIVISNYVNGVDDISIKDLTRLFKGEIKNWKELGGNDLPVAVGYLSEDIESGVVMLFKEFTIGSEGKFAANGVKLDDPVKVGLFVYSTPGGISFLSLNSFKDQKSTVMKIEGFEPTTENILNDKYTLSATYYITAPVKKNAIVADFMEFSRSKEGQEIVAKNFIPYTK